MYTYGHASRSLVETPKRAAHNAHDFCCVCVCARDAERKIVAAPTTDTARVVPVDVYVLYAAVLVLIKSQRMCREVNGNTAAGNGDVIDGSPLSSSRVHTRCVKARTILIDSR